jgi:hypothetical protein
MNIQIIGTKNAEKHKKQNGSLKNERYYITFAILLKKEFLKVNLKISDKQFQ